MAASGDREKRIAPRNQFEARIWNKYNTKFNWIPIRDWPASISRAVISESVGNRQRFEMALYFVGNGMEISKAFKLINDIGRSYFDRAAKSHLAYVFNHLHIWKTYSYFNNEEKVWKTFDYVPKKKYVFFGDMKK